MPVPALPARVQRYLGTSKSEVGAILDELFTPDAVVHDEGRTHVGIDAIKAWNDAVAAAFTFTRMITAATIVANAALVTVTLTGDFPGSPVDLHHHFTVDGDKITAMTICP